MNMSKDHLAAKPQEKKPIPRFSTWGPSPSISRTDRFIDRLQLYDLWAKLAWQMALIGLIFSGRLLILPLLLVAIILTFAKRASRSTARVDKMMDLAPPVDQFPVSVIYSVRENAHRLSIGPRNLPTGIDQGLISFVEGMMVFQGVRTTFSIDGRDLSTREGERSDAHSRKSGNLTFGEEVAMRYAFNWQEGLVGGKISINLYPSSVTHRSNLLVSFAKAYYGLLDQSPGSPREVIFPPFGPDPDYIEALQKEKRALAYLAATAAVISIFVAWQATSYIYLAGAYVVLFGAWWVRISVRIRVLEHRKCLGHDSSSLGRQAVPQSQTQAVDPRLEMSASSPTQSSIGEEGRIGI